MAGNVKISVIATGFDPARPLKRIEAPVYRRMAEPRPVERATVDRTPVGVATNGSPERADERKYDPNDLEVPSFLRRR
jgi:hypothetical protein